MNTVGLAFESGTGELGELGTLRAEKSLSGYLRIVWVEKAAQGISEVLRIL